MHWLCVTRCIASQSEVFFDKLSLQSFSFKTIQTVEMMSCLCFENFLPPTARITSCRIICSWAGEVEERQLAGIQTPCQTED